MQTREIELTSNGRGLLDVTSHCASFCRDAADGGDGLLHLFLPHATAGLVVMELGSGSDADLMEALDRLLPRDERWRHSHGSPGHGADHLVPLFSSPSLSVPVLEGRLALGTWQSIAVLDPNRDNSHRRLRLSFVPA